MFSRDLFHRVALYSFLLSLQTFKNPKPALLALLRESGPVPGDENGVKSKRAAGGEEGSKKKKRTEKNVSLVSLLPTEEDPLGRRQYIN